MIANSAVDSRQRSRLARVLVMILGLLLAGASAQPVGAAPATGHSATGHHAVTHSPTAPAPAHRAHSQPLPAGLDGGAAAAPDHASSACARGMHAAGHSGHAGCLCLHASCGGFAALFNNNVSPPGAIGAPRFIDARHPGEPLPAHAYRPLRPPTQLNA